ncbi:hypothetical protein [Clostridium cellulovorans]|uniref:Uncharacterized protein n=1 Tax=Clostridium cellulovorans (strain ATCC 35296 / DSM 3052 / OCM 3 / 743B) TaxID=573061 RepID=D9SUC3_CLOC7|nr:hypothetical protein [Clostridium cellulovorans]ADL52878.1 hypothetical protein Clocel_3192 [Clostridium cellulovorans 743B]
MKKKLIISSILIIAITGSFYGINTISSKGDSKSSSINTTNNSAEEISQDDAENKELKEIKVEKENIEVVNMSGKMSKIYRDVDSLEQESGLVVEGTVISNEYIEENLITFTISTVKVTKVLKGNDVVKAGDTVKMLQTGGIMTVKSNPSTAKEFDDPKEVEKNIGKKVEIALEGVPVLKEGESAIIFLQKYQGSIVKDGFVATGDYQGRFKIKNDETAEPQSDILKETYKAYTVEDFENSICK